LEEGRGVQVFGFADALTTAQTLLLATNSLLPYSLSTRELGEREELKEKTAHIADLILEGLLLRSGELSTGSALEEPG
jgi:hypothetical protein